MCTVQYVLCVKHALCKQYLLCVHSVLCLLHGLFLEGFKISHSLNLFWDTKQKTEHRVKAGGIEILKINSPAYRAYDTLQQWTSAIFKTMSYLLAFVVIVLWKKLSIKLQRSSVWGKYKKVSIHLLRSAGVRTICSLLRKVSVQLQSSAVFS